MIFTKFKTKFREFCSNSSIHGVGYFFGEYPIIARIFWAAITVFMLSMSIVWLRTIAIGWSQYPVTLKTESLAQTIDNDQYPTVTICNTFAPSAWSFMKNLLNLVKFKCTSQEDCEETNDIRKLLVSRTSLNKVRHVGYEVDAHYTKEFFHPDLMLEPIFATGLPQDSNPDKPNFVNFSAESFEFPWNRQRIRDFTKTYQKMNLSWASGDVVDIQSLGQMYNVIQGKFLTKKERFDYVYDIWKRKMTCRINNTGVYEELGVKPTYKEDPLNVRWRIRD